MSILYTYVILCILPQWVNNTLLFFLLFASFIINLLKNCFYKVISLRVGREKGNIIWESNQLGHYLEKVIIVTNDTKLGYQIFMIWFEDPHYLIVCKSISKNYSNNNNVKFVIQTI